MIWVLLFVGLVAHSGLLWAHAKYMWAAEHYQFFPVALIAAAALLASKRSQLSSIALQSESSERAPINTLSLSIVLLFQAALLAFAILVGLPLLGWLSLLLFLAALIYATYGLDGLKVVAPVFVVLLIIRPLPESLELSVTVWMQRIASGISSRLLDGLGVLHYRQGVVLVLSTQSFMAEEACSGIRSLFSSITAIVFWGLVHRYSFGRHVLNVLQTIMWVMVFNAIRITLVVWMEDNTDYSLATGMAHDALGLAVFFCIFGMVLSTDQLVSSFVQEEFDTPVDAVDAAQSQEKRVPWLQWRAAPLACVVWIGVFTALAFATLRLQFVEGALTPYDSFSGERELGTPTEDFLPNDVMGWNIAQFEHVHRPDNHQMGSDSYMWTLDKGNKRVIVSIDGTFDHYHELALCYTNIGWVVKKSYHYDSLSSRIEKETRDDDDLTRLSLSKSTGETGLVLFTAVDREGDVIDPNPQKLESIPTRIGYSLKAIAGLQSSQGLRAMVFEPPVSTIQMVYQPTKSFSDEDEAEVRALFLNVRSILRDSKRFKR